MSNYIYILFSWKINPFFSIVIIIYLRKIEYMLIPSIQNYTKSNVKYHCNVFNCKLNLCIEILVK
jgi:hypothetical protein